MKKEENNIEKEPNKALSKTNVSGSTFIAVCQETGKAYIFDGSEMFLWENDEEVDIYEVKYYR